MFTDGVTIQLCAGKGGNGVVAWRREKYIPKGGPSGGNGGKGGDIILVASNHFYSLDSLKNRRMIRAEDGKNGGGNKRIGKSGADLKIDLPCGTLVKDAETGELLCDLTEPGQTFLLCEGGKGGKGNVEFKSSTNQAPNKFTFGRAGKERKVFFELKLIADVGFVGMPGAGKSTLLNALTATKVKIGDYPFTTLAPNLSYLEFDDYSRIYLADIPGIIEGAHLNKGLGHEFLRHIERSKVIVYVIDVSGMLDTDPVQDFLMLRKELESYRGIDLIRKPFLVLLNKIDRLESESVITEVKDKFPVEHKHLYCISALTKEGLTPAVKAMKQLAQIDGKRFV